MAPDTAHAFESPSRKTVGPWSIALIGGAVSGGAVAAFSGGWACAALGAAVVAAAVCGLAAYIFLRHSGQRQGRIAAMLVVLVMGLAVAQVAWTRTALRRDAFRTAFGADPPAGLQELQVRRHYAGGPGDTVTLMRFKANPELISALVGEMPASAETDLLLEDYRAERLSAQELWRECFGLADPWAGDWWPSDAPPLKEPLIYVKPENPDEMPPSRTMILWDRGTRDVYVMNTVG